MPAAPETGSGALVDGTVAVLAVGMIAERGMVLRVATAACDGTDVPAPVPDTEVAAVVVGVETDADVG